MTCIVAMASHFVDKVVRSGVEPPKEVVGALSVVSFSVRSYRILNGY